MSTDPAVFAPYFEERERLFDVVRKLYGMLGERIADRKYVYHRGAFYDDLASSIDILLAADVQPFEASAYNWFWWAEQCRERAKKLGLDAQYAMILPPPMPPNAYVDAPFATKQVDFIVAKMMMFYQQEDEDATFAPLGNVTPAECVKISHRLAAYVLPEWCYTIEHPTPQHPGIRVTWPWLTAVADEMRKVYRSMGEPDKAGSAWNLANDPNVPPISWPGDD